jgi:hypothetical protein
MPIDKDQIMKVLDENPGWKESCRNELEAVRWWVAVYEADCGYMDQNERETAEMLLAGVKPVPKTWATLINHLNECLWADDPDEALKNLEKFYWRSGEEEVDDDADNEKDDG